MSRLFGIFILGLIFGSAVVALSPIPKPEIQQVEPKPLRAVEKEMAEKRAACPNNCNGHGTCNTTTSTCTCAAGWVGVDCSIQLIPLTNNVAVTSSVALHEWRIFTVSVGSGTEQLVVEVNETTAGDADLFIRYNNIPSRDNYDYKDVSSKTKMRVAIDTSSRPGTWNIGVFGYYAVNFTIRASFSGNLCPNNCNNHGACINGVCNCTSGYYGADCSANYRDLAPNTPITDDVAHHQWKYFRSHLTSGNTLTYELMQLNLGDCDIYVQYNQIPTLTNYLYSNVTTFISTSITINDAALGYWYVGVYGFQTCMFRIVQDPPKSVCPNECTHRGTCTGTTCECRSGSTGDYCQTLNTPLVIGTVYQGYVQQGLWNYYHYVSNSLDNLVVTVNQEKANEEDCDLYVKAGSMPDRSNYDYRDQSLSQVFSLDIPRAGQATWYIGVYGWKICTYTIRVDLSSTCPNNCNNHGSCNSEGVCDCEPGFSGVDCSKTADPLQNNVVVSGTVGANQWAYYYFYFSSESVYFQLHEVSTVGELGLYVSKDVPDLRNYEYASASTQESVHRISVHFDTPEATTYQVAVYGGPFIQQNRQVQFQLVAYSPNF